MSAPRGTRTPVLALRGPRPRPLDDGGQSRVEGRPPYPPNSWTDALQHLRVMHMGMPVTAMAGRSALQGAAMIFQATLCLDTTGEQAKRFYCFAAGLSTGHRKCRRKKANVPRP